jgi:hypothetical protein
LASVLATLVCFGSFLALALVPAAGAVLPLVTATSPAQGASWESSAPISFTFNVPMRPEHVRTGGALRNVSLEPATGAGGLPVVLTAALVDGGTRLVLAPSVPLSHGQTYAVTLACGDNALALRAADARYSRLAEGQLLNPLVFTAEDTTSPSVVGWSVAEGANQTSVNTPLCVRFSEPMDPGALEASSTPAFTFTPAWAPDYRSVVLTHPGTPLEARTHYSLGVTGRDFSGHSLGNEGRSRGFTTGAPSPADTEPPRLISVDPVSGAQEVPGVYPLTLAFSEPLDTMSLQVALERQVSGSWKGVTPEAVYFGGYGNEVRVLPGPLECGPTTYRLRVLAASDLFGNAMAAAEDPLRTTIFTTQDRTPPKLSSLTPANGSDVPPNLTSALCLTFTEPIGTGSGAGPRITASYLDGGSPSFTAGSATPSGSGAWTADRSGDGEGWSQDRRRLLLCLRQDSALPPGATLAAGRTLVITATGIQDAHGNDLDESVSPVVWTLRVTDDSRPRLVSTYPAPGGTAGPSDSVVLTFSKPMRPGLCFQAVDDYKASCDPIGYTMIGSSVVPVENWWKTKSGDWNDNFTVLTLSHLPFAADDTPSEHSLLITIAKDTGGRTLEGLAPEDPTPLAQLRWWVRSAARVDHWEYQAPQDGVMDLSSFGLLLDGSEGSGRWHWATLPADETTPAVPRNSRLRCVFSRPQDTSRTLIPACSPPLTGWTIEWEGGGLAACLAAPAPMLLRTPAPHLRELSLSYAPGTAGERLESPPVALTLLPAVGVPGDVDGDWRVSSRDLSQVVRCLLGLVTLSPDGLRAADVAPVNPDGSRGDGRLSMEDLVACLRRFLGYDS